MSEWILRWQYGPRYLQWLTLLGIPLLMMLLIGYLCLQPLYHATQKMMQQSQQLQQQYAARSLQLQAQPSLAELKQQNQRLHTVLHADGDSAFSLLALMVAGVVIEKWQPAVSGNELTLLLNWQQFQQALSYLASRQPPVSIHRLQLQRSGEQLRMTLNVGVDNEP